MKKLNSDLSKLFAQIREDWEAHGRDWRRPGFRAIAVYRYGNWARNRQTRTVRRALSIVYAVMYRYIRNYYGIELPCSAIVGRRVVIGHQSGIVIHQNAEIGDDCLIRHNVTIGASGGHSPTNEAPKLGHGVKVGCGAAILGNITIGDGALIGSNAVVMTDIPAGARVFVETPHIRVIEKGANNSEAVEAIEQETVTEMDSSREVEA